MLAVSDRLLGVMLRPADESRTWVFSDPHFEHEASVGIFGRPFRGCHHGDGYLLEQWTRDVMDHDTVICLGDVAMGRPTDGLIDRVRRRPGRKILVVGNHDHAHIRRLRRAFEVVDRCPSWRALTYIKALSSAGDENLVASRLWSAVLSVRCAGDCVPRARMTSLETGRDSA